MAYRLVADIGGTNSRLGLAHHGTLQPRSVRSYRNADHAGFEHIIETYLDTQAPTEIGDMVAAVAGPVQAGRAQLTNRNWLFDTAHLSAHLGGRPVALLNDLAALGQAHQHLDASNLETVFAPPVRAPNAVQALVIGVGTGFNLSPVLMRAGRVLNLDVEYGHISLPSDVAALLAARIGQPATADFSTIEHVFSGRGYAALRDHVPDIAPFYAGLLGQLTRNLMLAFLPTAGIYFAGGVARNLLSSPAKSVFSEVFSAPFALDPMITAPVFNILDDAAALKGCAHYAAPDGDIDLLFGSA